MFKSLAREFGARGIAVLLGEQPDSYKRWHGLQAVQRAGIYIHQFYKRSPDCAFPGGMIAKQTDNNIPSINEGNSTALSMHAMDVNGSVAQISGSCHHRVPVE